MKRLVELCLVAITLATVMAAQTNATTPNPSIPQLREGISVEMPVTSTAAPMPDADRLDAVVASVTADGRFFVGTEPIARGQLAEKIRSEIAASASQDKTLYVKADVRSPYGAVVAAFDAARSAGVRAVSSDRAAREACTWYTGPTTRIRFADCTLSRRGSAAIEWRML